MRKPLILQWTLLLTAAMSSPASGCGLEDEVCEFWLVFQHTLTMMHRMAAVFPASGNIYRYDVANVSAAQPLSVDDVVTADGWETQRLVMAINGTIPGPAIEVYEGQTVIVHVKNLMTGAATSVHWHGQHQPGTPWMDGVGFITQCPIQPGQSFTYRFMATPRGTFWYHSHVGTQRSMGLYGALVVRERRRLEIQEKILIISDWNHDWDSNLSLHLIRPGIYVNRRKLANTKSLDGANFTMFRFQSGLINGKGRFYNAAGSHNGAPLEMFNVHQNQTYRFRVISAAALYPFRVSVDEHNLTIVASDGSELQEETVESFIINPGERFDFIIHANRDVGNYWIRAKTLEVDVNHTAEAILRYDSAPPEDPATRQRQCAAGDECVVVNCPFTYYPTGSYTRCLNFGDLKHNDINDTAPSVILGKFKEHFLNFGFPGNHGITPPSINGRSFVPPTVSALSQPTELSSRCEDSDCGREKVCWCRHTIDLDHGDVVQLVFTNMGKGKGLSHPIHVHGHSFYVLKMGYGYYNETTGVLLGDNPDIDCRGKFCNDATWSNTSWKGGNVPGLELANPPRKDTIIVPTSGYVVVRIRADNPGAWLLHCHIDFHNNGGMAMVLNESFANHKRPPVGFPVCRNFEPEKYVFLPETSDESDSSEPIQPMVFWVVVGCLSGVVLIELFIIGWVCLAKRQNVPVRYDVSGGHENEVYVK